MIYQKPPTDIDEQLKLLSVRGLRIDDISTAKAQLSCISYFRLANYLKSMEAESEAKTYKEGSAFGDAIALYQFDKELRKHIFSLIQDIEIAMRTRVIQCFSMRYGAHWFMKEELFVNKQIFESCLKNIEKETSRSNEEFISEYYAKYKSPAFPPVWKTFEVISFGTLSKLFCNFADVELKKQVARSFGLPQYTYLESWIKCASVLRNCCAHHARLWNRRFPLKPQVPERLPLAWLTTKQHRPQKLYHQLCFLLYLQQSIWPKTDFISEFKGLLYKCTNVNLHSMGFPLDWQGEPLRKEVKK